MPESLDDALLRVRKLLLDPDHLIRAVAAGRRRGVPAGLVRAEVRPVTLKAGPRVQVMTNDGSRPTVRNLVPGPELDAAIDALLAEPFGNWHVETATETLQLRVTKRGDAQVHVETKAPQPPPRPNRDSSHDRVQAHLIPPDDPLFSAVGANAAKRRQVDAFVRALEATLRRAR